MRFFLLSIALLSGVFVYAQVPDLSYYLPADVSYNKNIPTPESVIGHQVGKWHVTHDKLVAYMYALAASSDRIEIENRGKTYEDRPILLLKITSPQNHKNLEEIRVNHLKIAEFGSELNIETMPAVVYQGFSIHGNEPSGANASLIGAYYLAAAEGPKIDELLQNTVILFDPSFNPDGLQRFAGWVNMHKSENLNPDGNDREFNEVWPGGRTNHYWFDMNRDWLPVQLPESKARIKTYHDWKPNILTDHHEMGTNATFFFQPGVPSRTYPLTPKMNQTLTGEIAKYHIKALDKIGSLYYSEESFDDFYYGKGSTFPDINGGIGILFEQASSRGHIQESDNGLLTFPFTIRNQFTTILSTLEAAVNLRVDLLQYQRDFYMDARNAANKRATKTVAYVFGDSKDAARGYHLAEIMKRHKIKIHQLNDDAVINGVEYKKETSFAVPLKQDNYLLIEAMFEKRTQFEDSIFYDVSAWTYPLAFNLDYAEISNTGMIGDEITQLSLNKGKVSAESAYGYLFEWNEYYTPKALYSILEKGIRVKVAKLPFTVEGGSYDYGSIFIPVQNQKLDKGELYSFLQSVVQESNINLTSVSTGSTMGIDLGSNNFELIELPKVALIIGDGISSSDAGEIWHLFDQRYNIPITKIDVSDVGSSDLDRYTTIIVPSSGNSTLDENSKNKMKEWVSGGGTLIGYRYATSWLKARQFIDFTSKSKTVEAKDVNFDQRSQHSGAQVTGGAIFQTTLDRSHPINYGYKNDKLPMFRNTNLFIEPDKSSYNNPIKYTESPLLSGYISEENLEQLRNTVPFQVKRNGSGRVLIFTDNTNFRAFWFGTNKLLMNGVFFSKLM